MREEGVMFDDERGEAMGGADLELATHGGREEQRTWRDVDRALRACARRRCELDAEEARWLVAAERLHVHRELGARPSMSTWNAGWDMARVQPVIDYAWRVPSTNCRR